MNMKPTRTERLMRAQPITRETLLRLPLLVPWGVVREVTGLSDSEVSEEVKAGRIRTWQSRGSKMRRYYRDDVLRLAGLGSDAQANGLNPPGFALFHPEVGGAGSTTMPAGLTRK